jgi:hypothetical protein
LIRIGDAGPVEAQLLSGISDTDIERAIAGEATAFAQCFEHEAPLVVGVTRAPRRDGGPARWTLVEDGGKVLIEAADALELRCGEAHISLRADGRIHVRGVDVTTRARRTQRIRGGTIQIN